MKSRRFARSGKAGLSGVALIWSGLFVLFLVLMGAAFYEGSSRAQTGREQTNLASDLRLLSQRMTTQALSATQGVDQSFLMLKQLRLAFEQNMERIAKSAEDAGIRGLPGELTPELKQIHVKWQSFDRDINAVLSSRETITQSKLAIQEVNARLPQLLEVSGEVAESLRNKKRVIPNQIYFATRQLMIAQRIENSLNRLMSGEAAALEAADRLNEDTAMFSQVLDGMLNGDSELGILKIRNANTTETIGQIVSMFGDIADHASILVEAAPVLYKIKESSSSLESKGRALFESTNRLEGTIDELNKGNELWVVAGFVFAGLALLAFLLLLNEIYRGARRQLLSSKDTNDQNQRAILTLLDEMATLADGDLAVKATVTEDITGAIADSINYAIEALRTLVVTINEAANMVADTAIETRDTALEMSESSKKQASKIVSASDSINDLTQSIEKVSKDAGISATVADQSLNYAQNGVETVRRAIDGMDTIREQIQDTSKRIKRLGESSQEIGDIVGLITDIADQTNILALNAAIQASSAGENGRGFAVVADEVQRLAERSANASKQIEALVRAIQADTNEAINSMEKSTTNVVEGAQQAEKAGHALEKIEKVSNNLAELIKGISEEAREQAIVSSVVGEAMSSIQGITRQTVDSTRKTAGSIGELVTQAAQLRMSVEGFNLPGDTSGMDDTESGMAVYMPEPEKEHQQEDLDDFLVRM